MSTSPDPNPGALPERGHVPAAVVDGLPIPILVSRVEDDRVVRVNQEFTAVYGHTTASVRGMPVKDLHHAVEDRGLTLEQHVRGRIESVEVRLRSAAGEICWAQADVSRFDMDGEDVLLTTFHDIRAQKAAERELADRARFPAMNPGPVARLDAEGIVLRANPAAAALFERDSLVGLSWLELCPDIDPPTWERIRTEGVSIQREAQLGDRWFSFTLRHEPRSDQVFLYGSDMTELKAAEQALAELARFPDMNPGPVCRLDRAGTVLLANRAAEGIFGVADLTGRNWMELVPAVTQADWERILTASEATVLETTIDSREMVLTHAPGPDGLYVFVYGSDVTHQKETERALRQSEKMATLGTLAAGVAHELNNPAAAARRSSEQLAEALAGLLASERVLARAELPPEARAALDDFAGTVREMAACGCELTPMARAEAEEAVEEWLEAHGVDRGWEIAPVLVEAGWGRDDLASVLERVGADPLPEVVAWKAHALRVYRLLEEVRHGSERVSEIVGAMRAYTYLGQAPVQSVDVNEGIRNTLIILRSKLRDGVTVEQDLSPDLPLIEAYGSELNQVWTNLLDNAVHAVGGQGTIRLRSSHSGDRVVVEVEDDGPGIPVEHHSQVFDAFFTTKAPGEGTGLGLHTTYNIVVGKHGGAVRLNSEPGRTRFTVELPLTGPPS